MALASAAGSFAIGGDLEVARLGFGALRITGVDAWGEPTDRDEAVRLVRRTHELGINLIDTADSYGPGVSEQIIRETLHPYGSTRVATKAGLLRYGPSDWKGRPGGWPPCGRPDYLWQQLALSLQRLGVDSLDVWQLHRIDPQVPAEDQFGLLKQALDEGRARHVGLSEVSVHDIQAAQQIVPISTVQNRYNLADATAEDVLDYCEQHGIGFIPWSPLDAGNLAAPGSPVANAAARHEATSGQIALAWLLHRSPVMLPIPGTGSIAHLEQNVHSASIMLTQHEFDEINTATTSPGRDC